MLASALTITTALSLCLLTLLLSYIYLVRPSSAESRSTLLVCLGSGGHTAEMLQMMSKIDTSRFKRRVYYISSGDSHSAHKATEFEKSKDDGAEVCVRNVARARRIKQSWVSTPFTTLVSLLHGAFLVFKDNPDLILTNGPGTCVVLIVSARVLSFLRLTRPCRIIFVESFARVATLSLSGKILLKLRLTDRFLVMWEDLRDKYQGVEYVGLLI